MPKESTTPYWAKDWERLQRRPWPRRPWPKTQLPPGTLKIRLFIGIALIVNWIILSVIIALKAKHH
jgi:hypothetical protein